MACWIYKVISSSLINVFEAIASYLFLVLYRLHWWTITKYAKVSFLKCNTWEAHINPLVRDLGCGFQFSNNIFFETHSMYICSCHWILLRNVNVKVIWVLHELHSCYNIFILSISFTSSIHVTVLCFFYWYVIN